MGIKVLGPISIVRGPALQYILDSNFKDLDADDIENDLSIGLNIGIAVNLDLLGIDFSYERGLSKNEASFIDDDDILSRLDTRPEQLILSLSYKL